jgi:hypothetical protein
MNIPGMGTVHPFLLLDQIAVELLPVTICAKVRKCPLKRRIITTMRNPAGKVHHTHGAQSFDQTQTFPWERPHLFVGCKKMLQELLGKAITPWQK